jgi:hypothetical protein
LEPTQVEGKEGNWKYLLIVRLSPQDDDLAWANDTIVVPTADDFVVMGPVELKGWAIVSLCQI